MITSNVVRITASRRLLLDEKNGTRGVRRRELDGVQVLQSGLRQLAKETITAKLAVLAVIVELETIRTFHFDAPFSIPFPFLELSLRASWTKYSVSGVSV